MRVSAEDLYVSLLCVLTVTFQKPNQDRIRYYHPRRSITTLVKSCIFLECGLNLGCCFVCILRESYEIGKGKENIGCTNKKTQVQTKNFL